MTSQVGVAVGFVMILGLLMILPSAVSFGMLASEMPTAGGVYAWPVDRSVPRSTSGSG